MGPGPKPAMSISAVVPLHPESQWLSLEFMAIQRDSAGEGRVRVGRSGKPDPALTAESDAKRGTIAQIPGNLVAIDFQSSAASIFSDFIFSGAKVERAFSTVTKIQTVEWKSLYETMWGAVSRKPRGPDLNRQPMQVAGASVATGIHKKIPEPPRSTSVG